MTTANPSKQQDPPGDAAGRSTAVHPGGGLRAERPRSRSRGQGGGGRGRRGHRRRGRDAQRHSGRDGRRSSLAQLIDTLPNLKLRGMLSYDGGVQHAKGFANRKARALKTIEPNTETYRC